MNGRERMLTVLRLGEPDRVPVFEISIDPGVCAGIVPGGKYVDVVEALDLDGACCGTDYHRETVDVEHYRDEWGTLYYTSVEASGAPIDGPIHCLADLRHYEPPDPLAEHRLGDLPEHIRRFKGQRAIIWHQREAFMTTALLSGLENFLMYLHTEPELVRRMVDLVVEVHVALVRRAVRAGAEIVSLGDDYAWRSGPFMSVPHFREFFLPGITRVVQAAHEEGALCFKHCDGNVWPLIDSFIEAGFDGLNPLEPQAGMDLGEVKRRYGDALCLLGNVDCGYTLSEAPIAEVEAEVKQCIRVGGPGGGYALISSNSLHSSVRPQNYRAMVECAHRYGRYPLDLQALA
jgi:uroporphyrinogen decarboxylase